MLQSHTHVMSVDTHMLAFVARESQRMQGRWWRRQRAGAATRINHAYGATIKQPDAGCGAVRAPVSARRWGRRERKPANRLAFGWLSCCRDSAASTAGAAAGTPAARCSDCVTCICCEHAFARTGADRAAARRGAERA